MVESSTATRQGTSRAASEPVDFEGIYARYFQFVWRCLRALGVSFHALDDAAQEVFLVVHRRLPSFRGDARVSTWLYAIVRHVAHNHRRTRQRKERATPLEADPVSPDRDPLEATQEAQAAAFVRRFVDGLDERKRDVFVLAVMEEWSVPEVANALSIPLNTAYTRLRNVRIEFRRAIEEQRAR